VTVDKEPPGGDREPVPRCREEFHEAKEEQEVDQELDGAEQVDAVEVVDLEDHQGGPEAGACQRRDDQPRRQAAAIEGDQEDGEAEQREEEDEGALQPLLELHRGRDAVAVGEGNDHRRHGALEDGARPGLRPRLHQVDRPHGWRTRDKR
jgi:hypothetical protein